METEASLEARLREWSSAYGYMPRHALKQSLAWTSITAEILSLTDGVEGHRGVTLRKGLCWCLAEAAVPYCVSSRLTPPDVWVCGWYRYDHRSVIEACDLWETDFVRLTPGTAGVYESKRYTSAADAVRACAPLLREGDG